MSSRPVLGMPEQVVAERGAGAEHGQQPHRGTLVVDQLLEQRLAVLDPVGEVGEVLHRLVRVGRGREQVHQLAGGVTEPLERPGGALDVLEAQPDQPPGRRADPALPHGPATSAGAGSRHSAANASASSRQVARSRSPAAATSST